MGEVFSLYAQELPMSDEEEEEEREPANPEEEPA